MAESKQNKQQTPQEPAPRRARRGSMGTILLLVVIAAALCGWVLLGNDPKQDLVWISGALVSRSEDNWGEGATGSLAVEEEPGVVAHYDIVDDWKGRELLKSANRFVTVNGTTGQDDDGRLWVRVRKWQSITVETDTVPAESAVTSRDLGSRE